MKALELGDVKAMPILLARSRDLINKLPDICEDVERLESVHSVH